MATVPTSRLGLRHVTASASSRCTAGSCSGWAVATSGIGSNPSGRLRSTLVGPAASSAPVHVRFRSSSAQVHESQASGGSSSPLHANATKRSPSSTRKFGQPMPSTHPHLFPQRLPLLAGADLLPADDEGHVPVALDELTPGIPASEYESRRRRLMERLPDNSVVVCMAGRVKMMSGKIFYRFRQESNFLYLTGFQEPDSCVVLEKDGSSARGYRMTMFVQPHDEADEAWNGPRTGLDGAVDVFGADEALEMESSTFLQHLRLVLPSYEHIYVDLPAAPTVPRLATPTSRRMLPSLLNFLAPPSATALDAFPRKVDFDAVVKLLSDPSRCRPLSKELHLLRLIKSENELRLMRRAGRVGSHAMMDVMHAVRPGTSEWQLQGVFEARCAAHGAQRPAYVPVVASGANALTIHYVQNDHLCRAGELVCMDAGCELDGYVSDITRAFPVDGRFTSPQRDLYGAVLNVLKACTALVGEDQCYTLSGLHRRSVEMLNSELRRLGFTLPAFSLERDLYPHALSHWLGMDLHDTATVERSTELRHGMCLSVEPAVYCRKGMPGVPHHFYGLGIRIEDDVAVYGERGHVVLNAEAPREVQDVEAVCSQFWSSTTDDAVTQSSSLSGRTTAL